MQYPVHEVEKMIDDFKRGKISAYTIWDSLEAQTGPEVADSSRDWNNDSLEWCELAGIKRVPVIVYYRTTPKDQKMYSSGFVDDLDYCDSVEWWVDRIERVEIDYDLLEQ